MNIIDKKFNTLTNTIKKQTLEEVYNTIYDNFFKINSSIQKSLEDYFDKFDYWGKLKIKDNNFEELHNRAISLKEHIEDYIWLYNKLEDYRSKKLLFAILNNWYQFDFNTLNTSIEKNYPHYFDLDIVKCDKNEIFVDLGAYIGDTIADYLNYYGLDNYKKIYCYEITNESFNVLQNNLSKFDNIEFRKKAVSNQEGKIFIKESNVDPSANTISTNGNISIETVTIDNDIKEDVTMIKMDIEGAEEKALLGCQKQIIKNKPKLLISVYHNHEDLWKIPRMISNMKPNYKFYLRYYGNNIFPTEIVLIAV